MARRSKETRPGFMIYFDDIQPMLDVLDNEDIGELFLAIMEYARNGNEAVPDDPLLKAFFHILKPRIDADREHYDQIREARRQNAEKRWNGREEQPEEADKAREDQPEECICMQTDASDANINTNTNTNNNLNNNININHNLSSNVRPNGGAAASHMSEDEFERRRQRLKAQLYGTA